MEHHIIETNIGGEAATIFALIREDEDQPDLLVYDLYTGDVLLGTIRPTMSNDGPAILWVADDMPDDLVKLIAEEIERQDW